VWTPAAARRHADSNREQDQQSRAQTRPSPTVSVCHRARVPVLEPPSHTGGNAGYSANALGVETRGITQLAIAIEPVIGGGLELGRQRLPSAS
jgi:hypothetical protein